MTKDDSNDEKNDTKHFENYKLTESSQNVNNKIKRIILVSMCL